MLDRPDIKILSQRTQYSQAVRAVSLLNTPVWSCPAHLRYYLWIKQPAPEKYPCKERKQKSTNICSAQRTLQRLDTEGNGCMASQRKRWCGSQQDRKNELGKTSTGKHKCHRSEYMSGKNERRPKTFDGEIQVLFTKELFLVLSKNCIRKHVPN